jgi:hypothetical protein
MTATAGARARRVKGHASARYRVNVKQAPRDRSAVAEALAAIERDLDQPFTRAASLRIDLAVIEAGR